MENQPPRINWLRLATIARAADADPPPQPEPVQPAQPPAAAPVNRQPALPIVRVPVVPLPVTQPRALVPLAPVLAPPAPLATQPTSQPITQQQGVPTAVQPAQPNRRPATPPVQPAPVDRKPVTPPQPDTPKSAVPANNNGVSKPLITAPSPPPSPKVIKTSTPTPPASPRVKLPPQLSPISVPRTADPEAETKSPLVPSPLKPVATQEKGANKTNGNGGSYNNTNTIKGVNGNADTDGKMNGAPYNNGISKSSNGSNAKDTGSHNNHGNMNHTPHLEKKEIENGQGMYEARAKPPHPNSSTTMPRSSREKSEKDMKVITLAGENIGAIMELGHNAHGYNRKMHHHGGGNTLTGESPAQNGKATESMNDKLMARSKPMTSLVNSNVQSINNSLLFNSSCTQKSPGVHLTFKTKGKGKTHK